MEPLVSEKAGVRYLHFSSAWIQGAMRIARPWALELDYTKEMMAGLLLHPGTDWPSRVLLIGLGTGSLVKFLFRHRPAADLTVVEIDASVPPIAYQYFHLPKTAPQLNLIIGDGADFVANDTSCFDLILVDGFDAKAHCGRLNTDDFYRNCHRRLTENGLLAANLIAKHKEIEKTLSRLRNAFDHRALAFPSCDSGNTVAFAATGSKIEISFAELRSEARRLKQTTGLNLLPTLARLEASGEGAGAGLVL